jgi:SAM-dependent methyltransferase
MIELARQHESRAPLGIRYERSTYADLSMFADGEFELVVSTMALMDSPGYAEALAEFYRVLQPGGELYFSITHPCFVTRHVGWLDSDAVDLPQRLTVAEYFNREPQVESWRFGYCPEPERYDKFQVPAFYRTLSEYVNLLIDAGFQLCRLLEPRPTDESCKEYPSLLRWRDHAALFLHIHAVKPEPQP